MTPARTRPSGWWYLLVPMLFIGGIGFAIAAGIDEGSSILDSFSRTGSDGTATITLQEGEKATIFALWNDGRSTDSLQRPPVDVEVTGPGNSDVEFRRAGGGRTTFNTNGDSGIDLGTFVATDAGEYEVKTAITPNALAEVFGQEVPQEEGLPNMPVPFPNAAVGRLDLGAFFGRILRPLAIGVIGSIVLWIALAIMRGRSKRRNRSQPQAYTSVASTAPTSPQSPPTPPQGPVTFN